MAILAKGEVTITTIYDGEEGPQGPQGTGVMEIETEFAASSSKTVAPISGWSTTAPPWTADSYIWQRIKTTFSSGSLSYTDPQCIEGQAVADLHTTITKNTSDISSLENQFGQFEYVNVNGEQILLKDHISSLTAKQLEFLTRDHLSNVSHGVKINGALIELASIPSAAVGIGDETLEDALAKINQNISQISGGGTNFIENSNFGTYDNPSDVWWSSGMSAQHFDARAITVSAFDSAAITVAKFDSGDF